MCFNFDAVVHTEHADEKEEWAAMEIVEIWSKLYANPFTFFFFF